ncbi:hypothetical protein J8273_0253 [Carpediemonas membranifera]|uniref:Uncharacterized protein n=1 Tax=Carpediemonas membranifera TaxID=201153 RepID=A0A8J6AUG9_9EUKA|nr:hypothetical protein J8273_0253 [Carpediemonas membranifera]|eukprot:KAG9395041.1 hypothetical protein J8273_0253 [Carpediemonas membranifera]
MDVVLAILSTCPVSSPVCRSGMAPWSRRMTMGPAGPRRRAEIPHTIDPMALRTAGLGPRRSCSTRAVRGRPRARPPHR